MIYFVEDYSRFEAFREEALRGDLRSHEDANHLNLKLIEWRKGTFLFV